MKKNFSGILAFILAIVMCVCIVPAAIADETYEADGAEVYYDDIMEVYGEDLPDVSDLAILDQGVDSEQEDSGNDFDIADTVGNDVVENIQAEDAGADQDDTGDGQNNIVEPVAEGGDVTVAPGNDIDAIDAAVAADTGVDAADGADQTIQDLGDGAYDAQQVFADAGGNEDADQGQGTEQIDIVTDETDAGTDNNDGDDAGDTGHMAVSDDPFVVNEEDPASTLPELPAAEDNTMGDAITEDTEAVGETQDAVEAAASGDNTLVDGEENDKDAAEGEVDIDAAAEGEADGAGEDAQAVELVSDLYADVEDQQVWDAMFRDVILTGNWAEDLVTIARTQIGYAESNANFIYVTDENEAYATDTEAAEEGYIVLPERKGYTRYGAWYGYPYDDWSAMFVAFCLNYAKIPVSYMPVDKDCDKWIETLSRKGLYVPAGSDAEFEPKAGDLVFLADDWMTVQSVGIISDINEDTGVMKVIAGDVEDMDLARDVVKETDYYISGRQILGYGVLPENLEKAFAAEEPEYVEIVVDENETVIAIEESLADSFYVPGERVQSNHLYEDDIHIMDSGAYYNGSYGGQLNGLSYEFYVNLVDYYATHKETGNCSVELSEPLKFDVDILFDGSITDNIYYISIRKTISDSCQKAIDAFSYDYPEVFWTGSWSTSYNINVDNITSKATINEITFIPTELASGLSGSIGQYQVSVQNAVSSILSDLSSSYTRYDSVKAIHDYICNNCYYNGNGDGKIYSSAGFFLGDGGLVCEGYSKTFKVLCDQFGIPCVLIGGSANTDSGVRKSHMWNYVQMENACWYLVDTTWDDQEAQIYYTYLLAGYNSKGFNELILTERSSNGDFSETGIFDFSFPELSSEKYGNISTLIRLMMEQDSSVYSPEMAYELGLLADAAYNQAKIGDCMVALGMDGYMLDNYVRSALTGQVGYSIGYKKSVNNEPFDVVIVSIRGTYNDDGISDILRDANLGTGLWYGVHTGFYAAASEVFSNLNMYLKDIGIGENGRNVKYAITGHSLGAGTANLLELMLMVDGAVTKDNLFGYNFACPDVAKVNWADYSEYAFGNIYNIGIMGDPVSVLPGILGDVILPTTFIWGKFGHSVWYSENWNSKDGLKLDFSKHPMSNYLNMLKLKLPYSSYLSWAESMLKKVEYKIDNSLIGKLLQIKCPVDVYVYDPEDVLIASIVDDKPAYYGSSFGQVLVGVNNHEKYIYYEGSEELTVDIKATADGTMSITASDFDLQQGIIGEEKSCQNIVINENAAYQCEVEGDNQIEVTIDSDNDGSYDTVIADTKGNISDQNTNNENTATDGDTNNESGTQNDAVANNTGSGTDSSDNDLQNNSSPSDGDDTSGKESAIKNELGDQNESDTNTSGSGTDSLNNNSQQNGNKSFSDSGNTSENGSDDKNKENTDSDSNIKPSTFQDGFNEKDGVWGYYKDGQFQSSLTGMVKGTINGKTAWYYIKNGAFTKATGITQKADGSSKKWYFVKKGVYTKATGIAQRADGSSKKWYFVKKGIYTKATGVAPKAGSSSKTMYYVYKGVYKKATTIAKKADGSSKTKYYVKNGKVKKYTGTVKIKGKKYKVKKGVVKGTVK